VAALTNQLVAAMANQPMYIIRVNVALAILEAPRQADLCGPLGAERRPCYSNGLASFRLGVQVALVDG